VSSALDESDPVHYCAKVSNKERNAGLDDRNGHPTVKPIDLCKYLATLLLPPDNYAPRRLFVPFSGSGSEMIGAGLAGWEQIVGVEFDTESGYVDIAKARLEHWLK
jgi:site-specific DNA-methyltransferase (adenine-specific)